MGVNSVEIVCRCGAICQVERRPRYQAWPCPACGRRLFVLPRSPFLHGEAVADERRPWPIWFGPVLAGGTSLLVCVALYFLVLRGLLSGSASEGAAATKAQIAKLHTSARGALDREDYARAHQELTAATSLLKQQPSALSGSEGRQLLQLTKEVGIIATWPGEPLDLIVERGRKLRDEEWQAVVQRYRGQGTILDLVIRRDAAGSYTAKFRRDGLNERVRLGLDDLALLKYLPLNDSRRVVLGGRLADLRRDDEGRALLRLEPGSGVLLTDPAVLKGCHASVVDPAGLEELATLQRTWAHDLPE